MKVKKISIKWKLKVTRNQEKRNTDSNSGCWAINLSKAVTSCPRLNASSSLAKDKWLCWTPSFKFNKIWKYHISSIQSCNIQFRNPLITFSKTKIQQRIKRHVIKVLLLKIKYNSRFEIMHKIIIKTVSYQQITVQGET